MFHLYDERLQAVPALHVEALLLMRRLVIAAAIAMAPSVSWAACGNVPFNIERTLECEAYTTDWTKHKDLKDKRLEVMSEWIDEHPDGGAMLEIMLKEGMLRRSHALVKDSQINPDNNMWKSRGCDALPVCDGEIDERAAKLKPPARKKPSYCAQHPNWRKCR